MQSTDLKPPLGSVAFFTHQDYQSEQYQIAYVHQPVKLQDHGIIKKRKGGIIVYIKQKGREVYSCTLKGL